MEGVTHRTLSTNGINMHIAEMGSGPVVLFLHGFPESWYSWRKQIRVFSEAGYHAVAPDLRGYGNTDAPEGVEKYTYLHIVGDLIGLLDALHAERVFLVAHDWGAVIGWNLCLYRPDRIIAYASLSTHMMPRNPVGSPVKHLRSICGEHYYICQFQEPGKAESLISRISPRRFFKKIFSNKVTSDYRYYESNEEEDDLPDWISEEDVANYVHTFKKNGFTPALNYYRALHLSWELTAPWTGSKVMVPSIFIVGDKDIVYNIPGAKQFIHGGGMAGVVPNLKDIVVLENTGHFLHEEKPTIVNDHILGFLNKFGSKSSL